MKMDSSDERGATERIVIVSEPSPLPSRTPGSALKRVLWGDGLFLVLASLFLAFLILFLVTLFLHGAWIRSLGVLPDGNSPEIRNSAKEEVRGESSPDRVFEAFSHAGFLDCDGRDQVSHPEPA